MSAPGALRVEGVDDPVFKRRDGRFHKAGFVEGVGVNRDLYIEFVGDAEAVVDGARSGAPVFMEFETHRTRPHLLAEGLVIGGVALAHKTQVHGKGFRGLQHFGDVPGAGGTGGGIRSGRRTGPAPRHGRYPARERLLNLLGTNKMNVGIKTTGRHDMTLPRDDFRARADHHPFTDTGLYQGITGMPHARDAPVFHPDVGLDDSQHRIDDSGIGDDEIQRVRALRERRLPHSVANDFAAAKFHLVAVTAGLRDEVAFHFNKKLGIGESDLVAYSGTKHFSVLTAGKFEAHSLGSILKVQESRGASILLLRP